MSAKAVFFDRDNTLIVNDGYLGDPDGVILMPGAAAAITRLRQLGFLIVTVSNQSGVARGLFDEEAVRAVDRRMDEIMLRENSGAVVDLHVYCPFHPEAKLEAYRRNSDLRKPAAGMFFLAAKQLDLDLKKCWMLGDASRDIQAGQAAGCRTILFTPPAVPASPESGKHEAVRADFETDSLEKASGLIEDQAAS